MLQSSMTIARWLTCSILLVSSVLAQSETQNIRPAASDSLQAPAVQSKSRNPVWNPLIFGSSTLAGAAVIHFGRYVPLWSTYKTSFFFKENDRYALNQDKFLHVFGTSLGSKLAADFYELSGMQPRESRLYGSAASFLLMSFQETEDGRINYLGFDRVDFASDFIGAAYPLAQEYFPFLRSFTPKMSYHSSGQHVSVSGQVLSGALSDHEGQTFWLGITVADLLPVGWRAYWPSIVGLAVGRGVSDLSTERATSYMLIALDVDLRKLPAPVPWIRRLWETLNYIHLPMPAVRISKGSVWYGLYF